MANILRPNLRWHSPVNGSADSPPAMQWLPVASAYGTVIRPGHPVRFANTGTLERAAAGETIWGVCMAIGPVYDSALGSMVYKNELPASTTYGTVFQRESRIGVVPVQGSVWRLQCDEMSGTTDTYVEYRTLVGNNGDIVYVSNDCYFDISTAIAGTTGAAQFQIVGVPGKEDQDFTAAYVDLLVVINEGQIAPFSTTGV